MAAPAPLALRVVLGRTDVDWMYLLWAAAGAAVLGAAWAVWSALRDTRRAKEDRQHARQEIANQTVRVPMRAPDPSPSQDGVAAFLGASTAAPRAEPEIATVPWSPADVDLLLRAERGEAVAPDARMVETPDGPMVLTRPPFALRQALMSPRQRQYARAIALKLPSGYVVCPQVRLDALVVPTKPGTRGSAEDWRNWRRRVRLRAVDFVICALPEWRPVVAIDIEPQERSVRAHQRDRIGDEVFAEVGLPLIRCSGTPGEDWGMIAPYVSARAGTRSASVDPDGTGVG